VERVGAIEEARARKDFFDDAAARHARDAHPIAAGDDDSTPLHQAFERFAVADAHRMASAPIGGDEPVDELRAGCRGGLCRAAHAWPPAITARTCKTRL